MRILVVNTVPTDKNGITNVIFNLIRAMDKQDLILDYVSINEPAPSYVSEVVSYGGNVFVIERRISKALRYVKELRDVICRGKYDVVHAHGNSSTLLLEMLAAKLAGCKVRIAHSHSTSCLSLACHKLLNPMFQICCTHGLACGDAAGKWLYGDREFTVINNGVDTNRYVFSDEARNRIRMQYGLSENTCLIGHVGIINENKNQRFLLDILDVFSKRNGNYKLVLIGDGPLRGEIETVANTMGIRKDVIFAGAVDNVPDYLAAIDIVVMPSLFEGLPLTLIEAQASGLPCVVSDTITTEADKTGNLGFIPLGAGAQYWADEIADRVQNEDRNMQSHRAIEDIVLCGFDIRTEAQKLKDYYQKALTER